MAAGYPPHAPAQSPFGAPAPVSPQSSYAVSMMGSSSGGTHTHLPPHTSSSPFASAAAPQTAAVYKAPPRHNKLSFINPYATSDAGGNLATGQLQHVQFPNNNNNINNNMPNFNSISSPNQPVLLAGSLGHMPNNAWNSPSPKNTLFPPVVNDDNEYLHEPPILEELGINVDHIWQRMKSVLFFFKLEHDLLIDSDMCGPLLVALTLGFCLLLSGKPTFGYIYGLGILGCAAMYILLNLMALSDSIDLYRTMSILGYGLLPVAMLAFLAIFIKLRSPPGTVLCVVCILWSTATVSRFFETALRMHQQRYLVAYPTALLYTCFVLITVF